MLHRWPVPLLARASRMKRVVIPRATPRLDDLGRPQVTCQTPRRTHRPRLTVAPPPKGTTAQPNAPCLEGFHHLAPELPEFVHGSAWPRGPHQSMEVLLPLLTDLIRTWRPGHEATHAHRPLRPKLAPLRDLRVQVDEGLDGIGEKCASGSRQPAALVHYPRRDVMHGVSYPGGREPIHFPPMSA
jgi:hypothetical protein